MAANKGFEAVTVLQGGPHKGATIAFSERYLDADRNHTGWLWLQGEPQRLGLRDIGEFDITDAKSLVDGALLVLERRYTMLGGVSARLMRIAHKALTPGAVLQGEMVAEFTPPLKVDNMEGLAVITEPGGGTLLYLMSDDNRSALQRTLLMLFRLAP